MQGPWEKTNGTASIKKTLGGSFIEEEYSGTKEGKPFLWKVFFARNNMTHLFQRTFIDSDHGVLMEFEGKKESGSLIFNRLWRYQNGNVVKLRVVYKLLSNNSFSMESMRMPEGSQVWDVNGRCLYKRMK